MKRVLFKLGTVAVCLTAWSTPGQAQSREQTVQTGNQQKFALNIPTQALSTALLQLADETGIQIVFESAKVQGLKSAPLAGSFVREQALRTILAGTGFTYRFSSPTTATLVPAPTDKTTRTLGPVRVEGADRAALNGINGSRDVTATEGTGSFTTGAMSVGSKTPRSIKETAQSVSVISNEQIEQQNINDFTRALEQAPGISLVQGGVSGTESNLDTTFYSRGYAITSIQIDGGAPLSLNTQANYDYVPLIDLAQFDHVEVLRGAAGLFNGYGDPSGTINLVRKKPLDRKQVTLDAEWGSWNYYRTVLDANSPLTLDGKLRGRAVMTWQSNDYFYDIAEDEKTLIYGVLDYDLTPTTLITAGVSKTNQDSVPWSYGLPRYLSGAALDVPRDTALVFPWNRASVDTTMVFGSIAQRIGADWTAKLNVTSNRQSNERKTGYSYGAVNPIDGRGPRILGTYRKSASDQLSGEATLAGALTIFGQRQEILIGANHSKRDLGGRTQYETLFTSSATAPYQPYPGGPLYCTSATVCPNTRVATPLIDVFAFDPFDPIYTEPRNPMPNMRASEQETTQTLAYADLRLTAFDRLHLQTGLRWSRYEVASASDSLCTSIPTTGTPGPRNCVGRQIGDPYSPTRRYYTGEVFAWPPAISLSYDVTDSVSAYLGYADIYIDQSTVLDADLEPIDPITGDNMELGFRWAARDGRINTSLAVYRIHKQGFSQTEDRYKRNPDGSIYRDADNNQIVITNNGTELVNGQVDAYHTCCSVQRDDQTEISEGIDSEVAGEIVRGWQVSASYTFTRNRYEGSGYTGYEGEPFLTIQPKHLYKLWTTYDFGAAGLGSWLSNLSISAGINGQSTGYRAGESCPADQLTEPNPYTGASLCTGGLIPFQYTVEPYNVVSGRIGYRVNDKWTAALNLTNIFDEVYYQSVGGLNGGNWYGTPRSYTLSLRGNF
ncbi:TonB-dependent siderophore receptor [Steroidobacter flavus]|uniref:TonB-dependent siderophore receptor n=1 Tax=Steroidobacter flavus TaxID=1842136 RepID=A0ABV8T1M6_9GAMM